MTLMHCNLCDWNRLAPLPVQNSTDAISREDDVYVSVVIKLWCSTFLTFAILADIFYLHQVLIAVVVMSMAATHLERKGDQNLPVQRLDYLMVHDAF